MAECIIRGDLANVRIGRHCIVSRQTVIRPPFKKFSKGYLSKLYSFADIIVRRIVIFFIAVTGCISACLVADGMYVCVISFFLNAQML